MRASVIARRALGRRWAVDWRRHQFRRQLSSLVAHCHRRHGRWRRRVPSRQLALAPREGKKKRCCGYVIDAAEALGRLPTQRGGGEAPAPCPRRPRHPYRHAATRGRRTRRRRARRRRRKHFHCAGLRRQRGCQHDAWSGRGRWRWRLRWRDPRPPRRRRRRGGPRHEEPPSREHRAHGDKRAIPIPCPTTAGTTAASAAEQRDSAVSVCLQGAPPRWVTIAVHLVRVVSWCRHMAGGAHGHRRE